MWSLHETKVMHCRWYSHAYISFTYECLRISAREWSDVHAEH